MQLITLLASAGLAAAAVFKLQEPIGVQGGPSVPGDNPLTFCESPDSDILTITNVDLEPNPPQKGKDLLITAKGTLKEDVVDGSRVLLTVKMGLITLIRANESLCDQLEKVDKKCPLKEGELTFQRTVTLPAQIPPAKFNVHADVYSDKQERITCMEANDISFH